MGEGLSEIAKALLAMPELMKEIYTDLAKPGAQQAGKALEGVIGLGNTALYPVHLANGIASISLKANLERFRQRLENVPKEEIIHVAPEIGVPIAEKLAYVSNEYLANMYTTLLAKASSKLNVDQAHPGFVDIINRLCPDEAVLLEKFNRYINIPFIQVQLVHRDSMRSILYDSILHDEFYEGLQQPVNVPAYVSNFRALGIIDILDYALSLPKDRIYSQIEDRCDKLLDEEHNEYERIGTIHLQYEHLRITPMGKLFLKACFTPLT